MSIIGWIAFGFVVGLLGKLLAHENTSRGFILTVLLGIGGVVIGGFLRRGLELPGEPAGILLAIVGCLILLPLFSLMTTKRNFAQTRLSR